MGWCGGDSEWGGVVGTVSGVECGDSEWGGVWGQ